MDSQKRAESSRSNVTKTLVIGLIAVTAIVAAAVVGYQRTVASASAAIPPTAVVTRGDVQSSVPADGRVDVEEWELGFGAVGRVESVDVSEGETVTAGQVLALLDDSKATAQVSQAKSALASAEAKLDTLLGEPISQEVAAKQAVVDAAASALTRAEEAYALLKAESLETTVSAGELQAKSASVDAAQSQLDIAKANLAAAKVPATSSEIDAARAAVTDASAGLRAATVALEDYVLRAPADGIAVSVDVVAGQTLSSGTSQSPAIVIADISVQRVVGQLDESDAAAVQVGMPVDVVVDALGGLSVTGRVEQVSQVAQVDPNGLATFEMSVSLDEDTDGLAGGMAVRMQVVTDQAADVLTIPTAAVTRKDGQSVVMVVDDQGVATSQPVELGKTDGKIVEVVRGLTEGQKVALGDVQEKTR